MTLIRFGAVKGLAGALAIALSSCGNAERPVKNFSYWYTDGKTCAKMAGKNYCIENDIIFVKNWETDTGPGFLVDAPVNDEDIRECNKKSYELNNDPPSFSLSVGAEVIFSLNSKTGKTEKKYMRSRYETTLRSFQTEKNYELIFPREYMNFHGMKCAKATEEALLDQEFICHEGDYDGPGLGHFFSCTREGVVPSPSCTDEVYYRNMRLKLRYSRRCAPFHQNMRAMAIQFIDDREVKAEAR